MKNRQAMLATPVLCAALLGCSGENTSKSGAPVTPPAVVKSVPLPVNAQTEPEVLPMAGVHAIVLPDDPQTMAPQPPSAILSGIVASRDNKRSIAVFTIDEGAAKVVRAGDKVSAAWTVASVGPSKVVLVAASGHTFTVSLGGGARKDAVVAAASVAPPAPSPAAEKPDEQMIERARQEFDLPAND